MYMYVCIYIYIWTLRLLPRLGFCRQCCSVSNEFSSFLDICPGVGLLDHMVTLLLMFKGTSLLFSLVVSPWWLHQFTSPPTVQEGSLFSTPSLAFIICRLFLAGYLVACRTSLTWNQMCAHAVETQSLNHQITRKSLLFVDFLMMAILTGER